MSTRMLMSLGWLLLLGAASAAQVTTRPAAAGDLAAQREQAKAMWERSLGMQTVTIEEQVELAELVWFTTVDGRLALVSDFMDDDGQTPYLRMRIKVAELGREALVTLTGARDGETPLTGFSVSAMSFDDPDAVSEQWAANYSTASGTVRISHHVRIDRATQRNRALSFGIGERGARAELQLSGLGGAAVRHSAKNLAALRLQQPAEVERHVRPMLRRLGWEWLLSVPVDLAWEVLADAWNVDAETQRKFHAIVQRLEADAFEERDRALVDLERLGRAGIVAAWRLPRKDLTPQQATMLDTFVSQHPMLGSEQAKQLSSDPDFLLDCLLVDDPWIRTEALERLQRLTQTKLAFDPTTDAQTREARVRELRLELIKNPPDAAEGRP